MRYLTAKERISQEQVKLKELTERVTDQVHACSANCLEDCLEAQASLEAQDLLKQHQMASHAAFVKTKQRHPLGKPQDVH